MFMAILIHQVLMLLVLDLEPVFGPQLPKNIEKLVDLRYLVLRWTYLETIPSSIGKLRSLQILDAKHTYVRTLPSSIWKLRKLQHLYLSQSHRSKFVCQQSGSSLKNLQTLWGLFRDDDSDVKNGLNKLLGLRKLALAFELNFPKQKALAEWVAKLKKLEYLRLRSVDQMGEPQDLYLEPLIGLENLCRLYLFGSLEKLSIMPEFPQSLSDLTLSSSRLQSDPMPNLEKLPNLRLLCFYSDSYMGKHMVCRSGGFPQLLVLKCWKLGESEEWDVQEQAMKNLRELELRSCKNLKVPSGIRYLNTLRELKLTNMPDKFTTAIEQNEGPVWDDIAYYPTIRPSLKIIVSPS
nr:putative disease resistance protein [Quercus suber]